jgi:hypothetical protein
LDFKKDINKEKMKKIFFKYLIAATGLLLILPGCEDFLETKPLDKMVEEDYWKTRSDVQSVLLACYKEMTSDDFMTRILVGGEFRSDNVRQENTRTSQELKDIMNMAIQTDNGLLKWKTFYTLINYCNRILNRAPEIVEIDPDYSSGMLTVDLGEARALRAMAYFYLIRIYHDVPYIDFPYDDDNKSFLIPKTSGEEIVDHIIADLEQAEREVVVTRGWGGVSSSIRVETKGRFTKNAVRALLADVYLWKASGLPEGERAEYYQKCIRACEAIEPSIYDEDDKINQDELNGSEVTLLLDHRSASSGMAMSENYWQVFYRENSNESIFELQFDEYTRNEIVPNYYGRSGDAARINASPLLDSESAFNKEADTRRTDSFAQTGAESGIYRIFKYVSAQRYGNDYFNYTYKIELDAKIANWIFYRVPDVFLMKAEALVELGGDDNLGFALELLNKTYERSNPTAVPLLRVDYSTQDQMRNLVLEERRREFLFEGKRWFDLLRVARKEGKSRNMVSKYLVPNAILNSDVILTKLSVMDALYLPIHREELLSNTELMQNPYYATDSLSIRK